MVIEYFKDVADASPAPVLIYNFSAVCGGLDLGSNTILAISEHRNIVGVKLTGGNTGKLGRIAAGAREGFSAMEGSRDLRLRALVVGGKGIVRGLANLATKARMKVHAVVSAGESG
jgi:dihydrodipicolinate synthase/N-acetylneuraminate lyase